jgi:hypothetical protein
MTEEKHTENSTGHGDYERRDIGISGVLYFLLALAVLGVITHFVVTGIYHYLENRAEEQQTPVSPLVTNAARDTRHLPPEYNGDYEKYLQKNFPTPQLEIDERNQLEKIRLNEEQTLSTYDWVDQKAGTVRIPIDRAMDLIAERGLPVRSEASATTTSRNKTKGNTQ